MSDKVGAIPGDLIEWPSSMQGHTGPLNGAAGKLNTAIEALSSAPKTAGLMGSVPYGGNAILGYVAKNQVIDAWVGKVGTAFANAEGLTPPPAGAGIVAAITYVMDLGKPATSTNAAIAAAAGSNPTGAADDAAAGAEAGAQLKEGVDTKDQSLVNTALSTLGNHQNDAGFDVPFFQTLGPKGTLAAVPFAQKAPDGLRTYDTALGTATRAPGWDTNFNAALFQLGKQSGVPDRNSLGLLAYGKDSADFLTQAGDKWLFQARVTGDRGFASVPIFNAMARNPAAGSAWLTGSTPGIPGPRIQALFSTSNDYLSWQETVLNDPGVSPAFNNLLTQIGGLKGEDSQLTTILHAIVPAKDPPTQFATTLWPGVAHIIADHIGMFAPATVANDKNPVSSQWTYNDKLFDFAETSLSSKQHPQAVGEIAAAVTAWTKNAPAGSSWQDFANRAGQLWALQALPLRQASIDALQNYQQSKAGWEQLASLIPVPPIPGAHFVTNYVGGQIFIHLAIGSSDYLATGPIQSQSQVDTLTQQLGYAHLSSLQTALALRWLQEHPSQVPPGQTAAQYAAQIGTNAPNVPNATPAVQAFAGQLGNAQSGFLQVYGFTGAAGPEGS